MSKSCSSSFRADVYRTKLTRKSRSPHWTQSWGTMERQNHRTRNDKYSSLQKTQWTLSKTHTDWWILKLAEETMDLAKKRMDWWILKLAEKNRGPYRKHTRTKAYSINLVENTSLQNPKTLTHVSPSCDFTCDWSKLNAWSTPWQHGWRTRASLVAISHVNVIGRDWPDRLSSASRITY